MARRRRRYAGTPAEHKSVAPMKLRGARSFFRAYRSAMKRGDCRTALRSLVSAAEWFGASETERAWARGVAARPRGRTGRRAVKAALTNFGARCLRIGYDRG